MPSPESSHQARSGPGARLGLLGGTFDPPHLGHLAAARAVRAALHLDRVDLLPANDPWQKSGGGREVSPASVRLEMVRALVNGEEGVSVDDREIRRGGVTYTADTLEEIREDHPGTDVFFIIGSDTARTFTTWRRHEVVAALSTIVVVNRGVSVNHEQAADANVPDRPGGAERVEHVWMEPVDVSSSTVRDAVARGEDVADRVGARVASVIARHGLYGSKR